MTIFLDREPFIKISDAVMIDSKYGRSPYFTSRVFFKGTMEVE